MGQAARLLGMPVIELSLMELNAVHHDDDRLIALAKLYQTTTSWLLGDDPKISTDNMAVLRRVEHTSDRAKLEEFMGMLSTPERDGRPSQLPARTISEIAAEREPDAATVPVERKRKYVRSQGQTRKHHCHWPNCTAQVPPAMWGCKAHWFRLPKALRDRIWRTYAPSQEVDLTPSREYLQVADDVQQWIRENA